MLLLTRTKLLRTKLLCTKLCGVLRSLLRGVLCGGLFSLSEVGEAGWRSVGSVRSGSSGGSRSNEGVRCRVGDLCRGGSSGDEAGVGRRVLECHARDLAALEQVSC